MTAEEAQKLARECRCADIHRCEPLKGLPNTEMDFPTPYDY